VTEVQFCLLQLLAFLDLLQGSYRKHILFVDDL